MPEFTSPWLKTPKNLSHCADSTDSQAWKGLAVSAVSETTRRKQVYQESCSIEDIRAFIAELPAAEQRNIDETVARILALNDDERALYCAELVHDCRAWRKAMAVAKSVNRDLA
jgi:hypothetical protein